MTDTDKARAIAAAKEAVVEAAKMWEPHYAITPAADHEYAAARLRLYAAARLRLYAAIRHLNELEQQQ